MCFLWGLLSGCLVLGAPTPGFPLLCTRPGRGVVRMVGLCLCVWCPGNSHSLKMSILPLSQLPPPHTSLVALGDLLAWAAAVH